MAYAFGHPKTVPKGSTRNVPCVVAETALLVVDVQEYCSRPGQGHYHSTGFSDKPYFFERVRNSMIPGIARLLEAARSSGVEVLYTVIEALTADGRDASLDYKLSGPLFVPKGHFDATVLHEIAPMGDEIVLPKTSCSVFCSTNINYVLRNLGTRYLIICGQVTNQCVESAVRDAADMGYLVTVPEDACAANSEHEHEIGLLNMRGFARLSSSHALAQELALQVRPPPLLQRSGRRLCLLSVCKDQYYGVHVPEMVKQMFDEVVREAFELAVFDAEAGQYPPNCEEFCGYLIMGSTASVSVGVKQEPWVKDLTDFVRKICRDRRPLVGVCFGHQVIATSLNGIAAINPAGTQAAFKPHVLTDVSRKALGLPASDKVLHLFTHHADVVVHLPPGAESWGYGSSGHWGMTWGSSCLTLQAHPEFSTPKGRDVLRQILEHDRKYGQMDASAFAPLSATELDNEIAAVTNPTDHLPVVRSFAQVLGLLGMAEAAEVRECKRARVD